MGCQKERDLKVCSQNIKSLINNKVDEHLVNDLFFFIRELTPRLIRQMIEKQLGLEEASLDASEYKSAIKDATTSALVSLISLLSKQSPLFILKFTRMTTLLQKRKKH